MSKIDNTFLKLYKNQVTRILKLYLRDSYNKEEISKKMDKILSEKFHARGPVGLLGLTSQKYVVFGSGQVRS
jgi:hypothetical protein